MVKPASVLIFAQSDDVHAQCVAQEISRMSGYQAIVLDLQDYPTQWELSLTPSGSGTSGFTMHLGNSVVPDDSIAGVWWRRALKPVIPETVTESKVQQFCLAECRATIHGWLYGLGNRVINPLAAELAANQKPYQLAKAAAVGLTIPRTIISNSPIDVRAFHSQNRAGTVFKILTNTDWQLTETRELREEYLVSLDLLHLAPCIFQEVVAGIDIRVTIVDDAVFAASIHPQDRAAELDWRLDLAASIEGHKLPDGVQERLVTFQRSLGLRFGAIDLRLTAQGEYVFLEVNPSGQFLFVEIHTGGPISAALATALTNANASL